MLHLTVLFLGYLLDAVNFHLAHINLVLVLRDLNLGLVVNLLLRGCNSIKLNTHVLDLLGLGVVDVGRAGDVLVTLFDFCLSGLVLLCDVAL